MRALTNNEIPVSGRKTYSLQQSNVSQALSDEQNNKKSLFLKDSYRTIKLPHFNTQPNYEASNVIISGKTYTSKAMEHQYLRIPIAQQPGSLNCQINCSSEFQIMISQIHPFPTGYNCEQLINNRGFMVSELVGEFVFVSFISRKDSALQFYIKFCQDGEVSKRKTFTDTPNTTKNSRTILFIVNNNIESAGTKRNRYQDELFRSEKFLKVLSTRNFQRQQISQAKKQKFFDIKAKELANKEKILVKMINQKRNEREIFERQWYTILVSIDIVKLISRMYEHKKLIIQKNRLAAFHIKFHLKKIKRTLQKQKGHSVEGRALVDSYFALKSKIQLIKKVIRAQQAQALIPILTQRAYVYTVKMKMLKLAGKLFVIKRHIHEFESLYCKYKEEMLLKWDAYNEKLKDEEIKEKQPNLRNKAFVTWFHVMKDKDFSNQMKKCFIFELMRDRIKAHLKDQQIIKKYKQDLKYYKQKLRICRDYTEATTLRTEIFALTNDIYAMCMKNQLFMHCDVQKYFQSLVSKYIVLVDEPQNMLPEHLEISLSSKQRQSRISLRKGYKKSKQL